MSVPFQSNAARVLRKFSMNICELHKMVCLSIVNAVRHHKSFPVKASRKFSLVNLFTFTALNFTTFIINLASF